MHEDIKKLLQEGVSSENGVKLDLGCGDKKMDGFLGVDKRKGIEIDIVQDLEKTPYKDFPDSCASILIAAHIVEHFKPWLFIDIMNEWWRILKVNGQLMISTPYAGNVFFWSDPTHIKGFTERTFGYFDPSEALYREYRPLPWKIEKNVWDLSGNLEVLLSKRPDDASYHQPQKVIL